MKTGDVAPPQIGVALYIGYGRSCDGGRAGF